MFLSGRRAFRRATLLATLPVAAVLGAAILAPSSALACPSGGVCTDSNGVYELVVPPLPSTGFYAEYRDCIWNVHVDFGDKTSEDLVFKGEEGISGTHTFPEYGKYQVTITLTGGYHQNSPTHEPCPNPIQSATVYYQTPQQIAAEEAQLKAEEEAKEKKQAEEKAAAEAKKQTEREEREAREKAAEERFGGGTGNSSSEGSSGAGPAGPAYWLACHGTIQVHGVGCPKARKVIGRARRKNLYAGGPQEILGFSCHLTGTRPPQISCRHGKSRVLAPL
jgi:hypothetical protein